MFHRISKVSPVCVAEALFRGSPDVGRAKRRKFQGLTLICLKHARDFHWLSLVGVGRENPPSILAQDAKQTGNRAAALEAIQLRRIFPITFCAISHFYFSFSFCFAFPTARIFCYNFHSALILLIFPGYYTFLCIPWDFLTDLWEVLRKNFNEPSWSSFSSLHAFSATLCRCFL